MLPKPHGHMTLDRIVTLGFTKLWENTSSVCMKTFGPGQYSLKLCKHEFIRKGDVLDLKNERSPALRPLRILGGLWWVMHACPCTSTKQVMRGKTNKQTREPQQAVSTKTEVPTVLTRLKCPLVGSSLCWVGWKEHSKVPLPVPLKQGKVTLMTSLKVRACSKHFPVICREFSRIFVPQEEWSFFGLILKSPSCCSLWFLGSKSSSGKTSKLETSFAWRRMISFL